MHFHPLDTSPPVLSAEQLGFGYPGGGEVFSGLSLTVRRGEFLALVGPSGCGKTTLLNLLSGFLKPSTGSVRVDGVEVFPELPALGYVFQTPNLFPWLTVLANVRFGLRMAGTMPASRQHQRAMEYLALVGLADVADFLPHQLSGGMRQRVALARALVLEPRILLMDEPFAALDAISRLSMQEELLRIWRALGQAIIFITHDLDEAVFLADRVLVLGAAPQGICGAFDIDLPRPRDALDTRRSERFLAYRAQISDRIAALTGSSRAISSPPARMFAHETI